MAERISEMKQLDTAEVAGRINWSINNDEPFSLVRIGDGEARLIGYPEYCSWQDLSWSLNYWYGPYKPTKEDALMLKADLIMACKNADVLGLPSVEQTGKNKFYKMLYHLVRVHSLAQHDTCHCGVHRWLLSEGYLHDILFNLPMITLVTCRNVNRIFLDDLNIDIVRWIDVPVEAQTGTPTRRHYPDRHVEVVRELADAFGIVLVGAGPNGKVYCDTAKAAGAVALDIGSVFDFWAGVPSRSYIAQELDK